MAEPRQAGWFGRNVLERILPGTQVNPSTGNYQNVGLGVLGAAGRIGAGLFFGPAGGAVAGRLANNWIDRGNPLQFRADPGTSISDVQREPIAIERGNYQGGANLGFPGGYSTTPNYQLPPSTPSPGNGGSWNSADIGLTGGVFNGGAPNLGQNAGNTSASRGFTGLGPVVPGYLSFGGDSMGGSGGSNPFVQHSKFIR